MLFYPMISWVWAFRNPSVLLISRYLGKLILSLSRSRNTEIDRQIEQGTHSLFVRLQCTHLWIIPLINDLSFLFITSCGLTEKIRVLSTKPHPTSSPAKCRPRLFLPLYPRPLHQLRTHRTHGYDPPLPIHLSGNSIVEAFFCVYTHKT